MKSGLGSIQEEILCVPKGQLDVFGYKSGCLQSVTNAGDDTISCTIGCRPSVTKEITLQPSETYTLDIDIWQCIRDRFMPYVEAPSDQDIVLRLIWHATEDGACRLPPLKTRADP